MKRRRPRIVIVGSINMDLVTQVSRLPKPGETVAGSAFDTVPGGKGANQAVAAARLGARAIMIGRVGDDSFGAQLLRGLRHEGVDTRNVQVVPKTSSGVAIIGVESSGQNAITVVPGANASLQPKDIRAAESVIASADAVLLQLEIPLETAREAAVIARKHEVFTLLDPAPVPPRGFPRQWHYLSIDIITPNESEAAALGRQPCTSTKAAVACLESLLMDSVAIMAVLKRGRRGSLLHAYVKPAFFPPFPVKAIDTTAAGDAFNAALAVHFTEGHGTLGEAIHFANAAGALATTRRGAQSAMPTRSQVDALVRKHPYQP